MVEFLFLSSFCRSDRVTIKEREKILLESEVSEEKVKKLADERKRIAAKVNLCFCTLFFRYSDGLVTLLSVLLIFCSFSCILIPTR